MLDVFFTFDIEVWCDGWQDIDAKFPESYDRYIYGKHNGMQYGLPFALQELTRHALPAVFFVEPLFALRFGLSPLQETVNLIQKANQEIQLHLHTEWVDEARSPLFQGEQKKRQHIRYFSLQEQKLLIAEGLKLLRETGVKEINAFRAGSFGFNADTLRALAANDIQFDSSYNPNSFGFDSGVMPGRVVADSIQWEGVYEYPMTTFDDGISKYRPAQITACSLREMKSILWQALRDRRNSFVILSHNFELLNKARTRPDPIAIKRFVNLCEFLANNRDSFNVRGFNGLRPRLDSLHGEKTRPLTSPIWNTGHRVFEQLVRRVSDSRSS